jgi:hypothetical protein
MLVSGGTSGSLNLGGLFLTPVFPIICKGLAHFWRGAEAYPGIPKYTPLAPLRPRADGPPHFPISTTFFTSTYTQEYPAKPRLDAGRLQCEGRKYDRLPS